MHAMKALGRVEVYLQLFISLAVDGDKRSVSFPSHFTYSASAPFYPVNKRLGGPQSWSRYFGED
jgi:hypothetical protein